MATISELAVQTAITQLGQQEHPKGSNWGHPVQDYLHSVGLNFPASWCMAFLYWCFDHAAEQLSITNPLTKTAGVLAAWNSQNAAAHRISMAATPLPGDIFIMNLGHGMGHTGIVESVAPDGTLHTIEGNTNDTGSREGFEVERKVRHKTSPIIGFLRYS